jgi:hypothetical protein
VPPSPRLIVRTHAPIRRWFVIGVVVAATLVALYAAFDWGRRRAGFDSSKAREVAAQVGDLEDQIRALRLELATQETQRAGQATERAELAKTIGELQAEVARQAQDLTFYRGVVGENLQAEVAKIQQFRVTAGTEPGLFHLRLVLGRTVSAGDPVSGTAQMNFEGVNGTKPVTLGLAAVSGVPDGTLKFDYRYVETLEQDIRLPDGFTPLRTTIELQPARKGASKVRQTFLWTVETL